MDLQLARPDARRRAASRAFAPARCGRGRRAARAAIEEMTDLPAAAARGARARAAVLEPRRSRDEARASDGTVKALFATADGRPLEAVLMRYRDGRRSICVSSQSGCPLTCTLLRDRADALRAQPDRVGDRRPGAALPPLESAPQRVDHCVFMGMGEPMLNLDNVLAACERLPDLGDHPPPHDDLDGRLDPRASNASPSSEMPLRLALSLHAADEALRSELMPVNERYPLARRDRGLPRVLRAQAPARVRRVRDARRRQRPLRAGARARARCSRRRARRASGRSSRST